MSRKPSLTDGLPEEMPDLDTLIDADAEFDSSAAGFTKAKRVQSARIVTFDARKVKAACDALQVMPTEGESVHIVVSQSFAGFDLIPAFLKLTGAASYQKLYLTTLGFSRDNLAQIEVMIRAGQIPPRNCASCAATSSAGRTPAFGKSAHYSPRSTDSPSGATGITRS